MYTHADSSKKMDGTSFDWLISDTGFMHDTWIDLYSGQVITNEKLSSRLKHENDLHRKGVRIVIKNTQQQTHAKKAHWEEFKIDFL
jgi:hypothetical protein